MGRTVAYKESSVSSGSVGAYGGSPSVYAAATQTPC
jgi:hypothetical protein